MTIDQDQATTTAVPIETEGEVRLRQGVVGFVRAETVSVQQAGAGAVVARGDVTITQGGGRTFLAAGDLRIQQGGGGMLVAGGDVDIREGGTGAMLAAGDVRIEQGGAGMVVARSVELGSGSSVVLALTPRLGLAPDARVMAGPRELAIAGAAAGVVFALLTALIRRIGGRREAT